eukprot:2239834-Amphidinium_carterae.1
MGTKCRQDGNILGQNGNEEGSFRSNQKVPESAACSNMQTQKPHNAHQLLHKYHQAQRQNLKWSQGALLQNTCS